MRELLHRHGALLTFDEVKTGFTTGPGGVTARFGVVPDIDLPGQGARRRHRGRGDRRHRRGDVAIADGRYEQVGTFNGNPLAMAATRATLSEVLTADGLRASRRLAARLRSAAEATIAATATLGTSSASAPRAASPSARTGAGIP